MSWSFTSSAANKEDAFERFEMDVEKNPHSPKDGRLEAIAKAALVAMPDGPTYISSGGHLEDGFGFVTLTVGTTKPAV